jgi:AcrR family transcriptional regulator
LTAPAIPPRPDPDPFTDPLALAIVDVVAEQGYEVTTIDDIVGRAGVTRAEFDRRFKDKEDAVLRSFEAFNADYRWRIESAYHSMPGWRGGLRAAAYEVADWMIENPNLVHFGAVDLLEAKSEMIRVRREEILSYGAKLIDRGRAEAADPAAVPDSAPLVAIGSIVQLLTHRLQSGGNTDPYPEVPQMMYLAVRPYLGEEAAREEITMPRPPSWRDRH